MNSDKEEHLKQILQKFDSAAIAYSGGVDSTYLADVAVEVLGKKAWLVIADTLSMPRHELQFALDLAAARGWQTAVIYPKEFENLDFLRNDPLRCYYCKQELFTEMWQWAKKNGVSSLLYGENADDGGDLTRVGSRAAYEFGARAPLAEAGFTKQDIRHYSKLRGLPTWDKPSFACLASRVPSGMPLSTEILARIEKLETLLRDIGCRQYRARHHGDICRIEVEPGDMSRLIDDGNREKLLAFAKSMGYRYVTLDLHGYRTGSTAGNV